MITEWAITECPYCGNHYASHLDACPRCEDVVHPDSFAKQQTALENNEALIVKAQKGVSKQRSKKVSYLHYTFDSQKEFERYLFLLDAQKSGAITDLEVHPKYTLLEKVPKYKQGEITYTADFAYWYEGRCIVEDVKGAYGDTPKNREKGIAGKPIITEVARLRHKLLIALLYMKYENLFEFCIVTDTSAPLAQIAK